MTLKLSTYEPLSPIPLTPPEKRRSPEIALALSILFPSLGHLYLGLRRRAAWLAGMEVLALILIIGGSSGMLHGQAILMLPSLYLFGMVDAYFSAREWNAGATDLMIGRNPRIAAILNFLTKGFGYFYLGDRTKGIVCFLIISAVQGVILLHTNVWTSILAVTIQIGIAVDRYLVARRRLFLDHPELAPAIDAASGTATGGPIDQANPDGLHPRIAVAFFLVLGIAMTVSFGVLRALSGHAVHSNGTLERNPTGLIYRNTHERIELTVPEDWIPYRTKEGLVALRDDGVSLIVEEEYAIYGVDSMLIQTKKEVTIRHPSASFSPVTVKLSGRTASGFETSFIDSEGTVIRQRVLGRRRGFKIFILVETWTQPGRRTELDEVEQKLRLE